MPKKSILIQTSSQSEWMSVISWTIMSFVTAIDTTTILSNPVSAKWCITLVWAENFVIKVFGF